jgi:hypothetical protein
MGDIFVQYDLPRPERANNRRVDGWRLCYTLLDTDGLAVLDNCPDVIDSIPKLMRDEKNIEDAQKEGNELFLDVCESFRYGVMSYASEQIVPREVWWATSQQLFRVRGATRLRSHLSQDAHPMNRRHFYQALAQVARLFAPRARVGYVSIFREPPRHNPGWAKPTVVFEAGFDF